MHQALSTVWVNPVNFLYTPKEVALFASEEDLRVYTRKTRKIFPKFMIESMEDSPLESLLAYVLQERPGETSKRHSKKRAKGRRTKTPKNKAP
jgi:hypothetical protein